jgi:alpha(1,3/1,4) fucosyltransferase
VTQASVGVEFRDFWPGFDPRDNFILDALAPLGGGAVSDEADLCFYSCSGPSHQLFTGCKVQVIGENVRPDFAQADFAIGYDRSLDDRFLRYPLWAWDVDTSSLLRPFGENGEAAPAEFCAFVSTNPDNPLRNALFEQLSRHRFVHAGGSVFNNSPGPSSPRSSQTWRQSKIEYLADFRFTIAAENGAYPGYTTEKLVDAFLAGSVPIYWGDPLVDCDFNPRAFLDHDSCGSVSRTVQAVLELDDDASAWRRMRAEAPMDEATWNQTGNPERLTEFLDRVLQAIRRPGQLRRWQRRAAIGRAQQMARRARLDRLRRLV